jgi:hypothetical protein
MNCGSSGTAVAIQKTKTSVCTATLAVSQAETMPAEYLDASDPSKGIAVTFKDGDSCLFGIPRTTIFNLNCKNDKTILTSADEVPVGSCTYIFDFDTRYACPKSVKESMSSGGDTGSGISWGTIVLIGMGLVLVLYCGLGVYLNSKKDENTGYSEAIPNLEFWRELPGLVAEGCSFTYTKLR